MADLDMKAMMKAKTLLNEAMKALDDAMAAEDDEDEDDNTSQDTTAADEDDDTGMTGLKLKLSKYK